MATIVFTDGTRKHIAYDKAARILEVLDTTKEPKDEAQAKFCERIETIEFESPVKVSGKDLIMQDILSKEYKTGYDKMVAVVNRIRERTI